MFSYIVRFCTAALVGTIIGITYEQLQPRSTHQLSGLFPSVSALSSVVPKQPPPSDLKQLLDAYDLNPEVAAANLKESSKYGLPSKDNIRLFNDYILSYDRRLRAPVWVIEHLTPEKLEKRDENVDRNESNFKEDRTIHEYFRAQNRDFRGSGYDRGHMAAAANHRLTQDDLDQTFILSNVLPQVPEFNRGGWERLETYVRWRARRSKNLYLVTGPLYLPMKARDGNSYVTYRVIGGSQVSVPTHFFKVFLVETKDNKLMLEAFLMPNDKKLDDRIKLDDYRVPIDQLDIIERASGVIFFDQLARKKLEAPRSLPGEFRDESRSTLRENKRRGQGGSSDSLSSD